MDTPSQEIARSATITITDDNGREIEIRKLKPIDQLRMLEIIGPENSNNGPYLGYAVFAYSVTKLDGQPIPRVSSKLALEAIVTRLDEAGINAVSKGFKQLYADDDAIELAKNV